MDTAAARAGVDESWGHPAHHVRGRRDRSVARQAGAARNPVQEVLTGITSSRRCYLVCTRVNEVHQKCLTLESMARAAGSETGSLPNISTSRKCACGVGKETP